MNTDHKKKSCRYCSRDKTCLTCNSIIQCRTVTSCTSCGGIYGRPLSAPMSAGCILLEYPFITIIFETDRDDNLKGTLNDIGGKYDPDLDKSILETVCRETREETGMMLLLNGTEPYVDIMRNMDAVTYRCYIVDSSVQKKYISTGIVPENPVVKMKIKHFLNINQRMLESRLKMILRSSINYPIANQSTSENPRNLVEYMKRMIR